MSEVKKVILAIDFDNDVGKLGVETPIIGFNELLNVANEYALSYPQDSDLNVLFTALKLYRDLSKSSDSPLEVALISGDESSSTKAGMKISKELDYVIKATGAEEAIVVVDSAEDEMILPVIQSRVHVVAVERVVVEQLRGVEETYILLGRYIRKVLEERRFSRIFLGLPGVLIFTYSILVLTNSVTYASPIVLTLLSIFLILKGFGIDEIISRWWRLSPVTRVSLTLTLLSSVVTGVMLYMSLLSRNFRLDTASVAWYLSTVLPFLAISLTPLIVGRLAVRALRRSVKVWRDLMSLAVLIIFYQFFMRVLDIVLTAQPLESVEQVLNILNEYRVTHTFFIYVVIIMSVSIILYALEKRVL